MSWCPLSSLAAINPLSQSVSNLKSSKHQTSGAALGRRARPNHDGFPNAASASTIQPAVCLAISADRRGKRCLIACWPYLDWGTPGVKPVTPTTWHSYENSSYCLLELLFLYLWEGSQARAVLKTRTQSEEPGVSLLMQKELSNTCLSRPATLLLPAVVISALLSDPSLPHRDHRKGFHIVFLLNEKAQE